MPCWIASHRGERTMSIDDIRIVLVEPSHPGNIGAVARAMNTMGLTRLSLVRPRIFPSAEADDRAVGSIPILRSARVVGELMDVVGDCRLVIGCSARARTFPLPELEPRACAALLVAESAGNDPVALVFGTERTGLENRDLDLCTHQAVIPTGGGISSLNLAAAVQLLCYEIHLAAREPGDATAARPARRPSHPIAMEAFYHHLESALDSRGFLEGDLREATKTKLRRLFGRARPSPSELKFLHSLAKMIHAEGE
jgi:tRNA (cytidine32/uridine32-2'-O)-methyltransferase